MLFTTYPFFYGLFTTYPLRSPCTCEAEYISITWQSQKQRVVALSSCEAEYITAATAACQEVWLACLLAELKGEKAGATKLKIDNQSTIAVSKNPVFHVHSKHIDVR